MPLAWGEEKLWHWNSMWMLPRGIPFWSLPASTPEVRSGSFYLVYPLGSCPSPGVSPRTGMGSSVCSPRPKEVETDANANLVGRSSSLKGRAALCPPSPGGDVDSASSGISSSSFTLEGPGLAGVARGEDWVVSEWALLTAIIQIRAPLRLFVYSVQGDLLSTYSRVLSVTPYNHPRHFSSFLSLFHMERLQLFTERPTHSPSFSKWWIPNSSPSLSESTSTPLFVTPHPWGVFFSVDFWIGMNCWEPSYSKLVA